MREGIEDIIYTADKINMETSNSEISDLAYLIEQLAKEVKNEQERKSSRGSE